MRCRIIFHKLISHIFIAFLARRAAMLFAPPA
jgi:hypothetical protein